ncbi:unnamed protein product [Somion occarium]|uniref:WD repeat-containing protein 75 second beta-propeller domain-containing protein n=1 Tax=Somion occarium TaxID=3059160 RepID=A0ABP1CH93_9APHY
MPMAVDSTPAMAASKAKSAVPHGLQNPPVSESPKKGKKRKHARNDNVDEGPVAGSSKATDDLAWTWRSLTESSASRVPLLFTKDGSYFFSASGPSVKIYSVATGLVVSTLTPAESGETAEPNLGAGNSLTCMALSPHNPFQLFTGSAGGLIRIWDFLDATQLRVFDLAQPIFQLALHEKFKDQVFVAASRSTKKINSKGNPTAEDNCAVLRVTLTPTNATMNSSIQKPSDLFIVGKTRKPAGLSFSPSGSWLVAIGGHKAYVARTADLKAGFTKFVSDETLTCLAFHPTEEYFATGDAKGVIRLWYCLNEDITTLASGVRKKAPTTTLHWHAHTVSSIAFTANGAYLLSGGEEAVLVIWQLHSGKKEFVPRVGAPIANIAVSRPKDAEEEYLLGLADASFVFVRSGTLRISRTVARIKLDPAISHTRPSSSTAIPLAIHPQTSTLILPSSHPSSLQTYAPSSSKLLSELEVSPSNRVSRRDEKALEPSRVERAVISESGKWMATLDARESDDVSKGEIYLKIWSWERGTGFWSLNTRIDRPHGLKKVTSVAFRPGSSIGGLQLATTGEDGNIKLWRVRSVKNKHGEVEEYWVTRATLRFRSDIPSHATWSSDGSILAVSLGPHVALYDPESTVLIRTLTSPECTVVTSASFVGRGSRYLAVSGHRDLVLWDLVSQTVKWHYRSTMAITGLVTHPVQDTFIIFEQQSESSSTLVSTRVVMFTPRSAIPSQIRSLPFRLLSVVPCPASWTAPGSASSLAFVAITDAWSVVLLGDDVKLPEEQGSVGRGLKGTSPAAKRTLFQDIFGASAFSDVTPPSAPIIQTPATWKGKEVEKIFDAPAYLMPPLDTLFDPLMEDFLTLRPADESAGVEDEEQHAEDVEMDAEGEDGPILVGNRLERVVDGGEMVAMVELFMNHAISTSGSTSIPNGIPQTNGVHRPTTNGVTPHATPAKPLPKHNGTTKPQLSTPAASIKTSDPSATPSSAARTGQKRKKSLD